MYVCPKCGCQEIDEVFDVTVFVELTIKDGNITYGEEEQESEGESEYVCRNCGVALPVSTREELIEFVTNYCPPADPKTAKLAEEQVQEGNYLTTEEYLQEIQERRTRQGL
jgi:hypothetical protein